ncbi:MAG: S8 family peptidase [Dehalococcoidales bacterium]|nr:S8 family peptidase [Dehalococcoidales bacterium]
MKKINAVIFITFIFLSFYILLNPRVNQAKTADEGLTDRVIIKFHPLIPKYFKNKAVESYGLNIKEELKLAHSYVIEVPKGKVSEYKDKIKKNLLVDYIEEDYLAYELSIPNDPSFSEQWGLTKIQAPEAWDVNRGSDAVDIAIVDSGINYQHPDLGAKVKSSVDCRSGSCPSLWTQDPGGHGTHVAGIAGAITNNSQGVAGVSWDANLMSVKVLNDSGSGYYSWIANGIVWAADNGAEVINLSLGGSFSSSTLQSAVNYAWNKGVTVVAASGNRGTMSPTYPAYYSNVIAVAAVTQSDTKASFSNYGSWVDVAAPGVSIYSTYQSGYEYLSGTSMASPYVAGLAALIKAQNPDFSNQETRQKLESSADTITGTGSFWKYGRINACRALGCTFTPAPTPAPTAIVIPTPTSFPSPTVTVVPTITIIPTIVPTPTAISPAPTISSPTPTPSGSPLPWWCRYVPSHPSCQK